MFNGTFLCKKKKKGEIDVFIYSNSLPYNQTHSKSKKEEDIKPPLKKLQSHFSKEPKPS